MNILENVNNKELKEEFEELQETYIYLEKKIKNKIKEFEKECLILEEDFLFLKEKIDKTVIKISEEEIKKQTLIEKIKNENNILKENTYIKNLEYEKEKYKTELEKLKEKMNFLEKSYKEEQEKNKELLKQIKETTHLNDNNLIFKRFFSEEKNTIKEVALPKIEIIKSKWNDYNEFLKNKDNLIELIKNFSNEDLKEIYLEGKKRNIIGKFQEKYFSNIIIRRKLRLPLNVDCEKIKPYYEKLMVKLEEEKNESEVTLPKIEIVNSKISNFKEFVKNLSNENLKEIYLEGKRRNIIKKSQEKYFSNIQIKKELNIPITSIDCDRIKSIYEEIIIQKKQDNIDTENKLIDETFKKDNENNLIKAINFNELLEKGLKNGEINIDELQHINYLNENDVYDIYEAIEIFEERGIRINY